ncbi:hypothetical protein RAH32_16905 [Paracoccus sp. WLY502]|uniref:hypothetical protein n=1 Tax=Paracoccus yibinensis TaxID=3068891 RepID=UPI002796D0E5|nr:hypothetical protein [Paracoccus sp. WLY502]MDQ1902111.1 hypothetical protein [Paracoccus sp. WLY502]
MIRPDTARRALVPPGNSRDLPCVCRPQGWITIWKRIGQVSVLDQKVPLSA